MLAYVEEGGTEGHTGTASPPTERHAYTLSRIRDPRERAEFWRENAFTETGEWDRSPRTLSALLRRCSGQQAYQAVYHGERATEQESDPEEAVAAMLPEPDLPNPQQDSPEAEHQGPPSPTT